MSKGPIIAGDSQCDWTVAEFVTSANEAYRLSEGTVTRFASIDFSRFGRPRAL
jgi:hypothetical protein